MKKKIRCLFYLQHKLPWEFEWKDVKIGNSVSCKEFSEIFKKEPVHLIGSEYRIVEKKQIWSRNKEKNIICPICIMTGQEIVDYIRKNKK